MRVVETLRVRSNSRTPSTDSRWLMSAVNDGWVTPSREAAGMKDLPSTATEKASAVGI